MSEYRFPRAKTSDMSPDGEKDVAQRPNNSAIYYEEILERCCGSGLWQALLVGYFSLIFWLHPLFSMSLMFIGATPEFRCADGFDENATFAILPVDTPECHSFGDANTSCTRWVFDTSVFQSTVVAEWNLVCGRKPLLAMLQSWLMIGGIFGTLLGGTLADRFGRRTIFLPAMLAGTGCAFAAVLVPGYTSYAAVWFLAGVAIWLMDTGLHVWVTEISGSRHRAALTTMFIMPFAFGTSLVAALSYAIRTRWLLQLAFAAPWLLFWPSLCVMPESPRWLVVQGRFEEALRVLRQGARWNRRRVPPQEEVLQMMRQARDGMLAREAALNASGGHSALRRSLQLVTLPRMRRYTLCFIFTGFVISASFYGISFDITQLSDNPHLAGVLSGIVDIPSYLIFPLLNWLGRRHSMALFLFIAAVVMFLAPIGEQPALRLTLGLIGKFGVSSAFSMVGLFCNETMPTQLRALSMTVLVISTSVGGAVAPFVVQLVTRLHGAAPSVVFGAAALLAAGVTLLLPETMGTRMPETPADVEMLGRRPPKTPAADETRGGSSTTAGSGRKQASPDEDVFGSGRQHYHNHGFDVGTDL